MFLLASYQTDQLSFRVIGTHGIGIVVFELRLRMTEGKHTISARWQWLRTELPVRGYPHVFELSGAIRERNAVDMRG